MISIGMGEGRGSRQESAAVKDAHPTDKGRRRSAGRARLGAVVVAALLAGAGGLAATPAVAAGAATTLATAYGCSKVKEWALEQPEALFNAWAQDRILGDGQSVADGIAKGGDIRLALSQIGDMLTVIQIFEEAAVAQDPKKVAQLLGSAVFEKLLSNFGKALGTGVPGAIWTTAKLLNDFAVALNAEIIDLNVKTFANFAEGDFGAMLGPGGIDYFLRDVLLIDDLRPRGVFDPIRKRLGQVYEYAYIKLGYRAQNRDLPPLSEWKHSNEVRSVIAAMLAEVRDLVEKRKKVRKLQGQLKAQAARLRREVSVLQSFQGILGAAKGLVCADEVSDAASACAAAIVLVDEAIAGAAADVADIETLSPDGARELRAGLTALEAELDGAEARLAELQAGVDGYCAGAQQAYDGAAAKVAESQRLAGQLAGLGPSAKARADAACAAGDLATARRESALAGAAVGEASRGLEALAVGRAGLVQIAPPEALSFDPLWTRQGELHRSVEAEEATVREASEGRRRVLAAIARGEGLARELPQKCEQESLVPEKMAEFTVVRENLPEIGDDDATAASHRATADALGIRIDQLDRRQIEARSCLAQVPDIAVLVAQVEELEAAAGGTARSVGAEANRAEQCVAALEQSLGEGIARQAEAAIDACKFDEAASAIAELPPESAERTRLANLNERKRAAEATAAEAYGEGKALYGERKLEAALGKMRQARAAAQCEQTTAAIDAVIATIEEARGTVAGESASRAETAIAACKFKDAAALVADLPEDSAERRRLRALLKRKVAAERAARAAYKAGKELYRSGELDGALSKIRDARGDAQCEKTVAAIDAARATIEGARDRAAAETARLAEAALEACEFGDARTLIGKLPEGGGERGRLASMLKAKARSERSARSAYAEGRELQEGEDLDGALRRMTAARRDARCERTIAAIDSALGAIRRDLARAASALVRQAETAIRACNFNHARGLIDQLPEGSADRSRLRAMMDGEKRARADYDAGWTRFKAGDHDAARQRMTRARGAAACRTTIAAIDNAIGDIERGRAQAARQDEGNARQAEAALRNCDFNRARSLINGLVQGSPQRRRLEALWSSQVEAESYFSTTKAAFDRGDFAGAMQAAQNAKARAVCRTTIANAEGNIRLVADAQARQRAETAAAVGALIGAIGQAIGGASDGGGGGGGGTGGGGSTGGYTGGGAQQCQGFEGEMRQYAARQQSLARQYQAAGAAGEDKARLQYLACEMLRHQQRGHQMLRRYRAQGCQIPQQAFAYQGMYDAAHAKHCG